MRLQALGLAFVTVFPLFGVDSEKARQAQGELFAARFDNAAKLYSELVNSEPSWAPGYYGWVRALLGARRATDAYHAADSAREAVPNTASAETAIGMAAYRRGEITESELHFRRALQIEPGHAGALIGLGQVMSVISKFEKARQLYQSAYRSDPNDPDCMMCLADQQEGEERIATLERVISIYDPATREAHELQARIGSLRALAGRKVRLTSPYQHYGIKLLNVLAPSSLAARGAGVSVELDGKKFTLLLDTGASGIALSPTAARRAGLEKLGDRAYEVYGIGDKRPQNALMTLSREVRIGNLTFADLPVHTFASASPSGADGLIGADVFKRFLVAIDFTRNQISLDPFPQPPPERAPDAADVLQPGFTRAVRLGDQLALMTSVNGGDARIFLVDSGASLSMIDTVAARETTKTHGDDATRVTGAQGEVSRVSRAERVTLHFAGFRQENSDLTAFDLTSLSDEAGLRLSGILGMPVLSQFRLTIDYAQGAVRLEYQGLKAGASK